MNDDFLKKTFGLNNFIKDYKIFLGKLHTSNNFIPIQINMKTIILVDILCLISSLLLEHYDDILERDNENKIQTLVK